MIEMNHGSVRPPDLEKRKAGAWRGRSGGRDPVFLRSRTCEGRRSGGEPGAWMRRDVAVRGRTRRTENWRTLAGESSTGWGARRRQRALRCARTRATLMPDPDMFVPAASSLCCLWRRLPELCTYGDGGGARVVASVPMLYIPRGPVSATERCRSGLEIHRSWQPPSIYAA